MSDSQDGGAIALDVRVVPLLLAGAVLVADGIGLPVPDLVLFPSYAVAVAGSVVAVVLLVRGR